MISNLGFVATALATHTITVQRFAVDTYDAHGRGNARAVASTFTTLASVTPVASNVTRDGARGFDFSERVRVISPVTIGERDRLTISGYSADFEVEQVERYQSTAGFVSVIAKALQAPFEPR